MVDLMDLNSVQNSDLSTFIHQTDLAFRLSKLFLWAENEKIWSKTATQIFFFY